MSWQWTSPPSPVYRLHPWRENPKMLAEALHGFVPCYSAEHHGAFVNDAIYTYYRIDTSTFDKLIKETGLQRAPWWPDSIIPHTPIAVLRNSQGRVVTEATLLWWGFGIASPGLEKEPDTTLKFADQDLRALLHVCREVGIDLNEPLLRERLQQLRKTIGDV